MCALFCFFMHVLDRFFFLSCMPLSVCGLVSFLRRCLHRVNSHCAIVMGKVKKSTHIEVSHDFSPDCCRNSS